MANIFPMGNLNMYTTDHTSIAPLSIGYYPGPSQTAPQLSIPPMNAYPYPTQPEEKKEPMRGLFEVFVVDPEDDKQNIVFQGFFTAKDETSARLKAAVAAKLDVAEMDNHDFIVRRLGDVRNKKTVQEVKVIP